MLTYKHGRKCFFWGFFVDPSFGVVGFVLLQLRSGFLFLFNIITRIMLSFMFFHFPSISLPLPPSVLSMLSSLFTLVIAFLCVVLFPLPSPDFLIILPAVCCFLLYFALTRVLFPEVNPGFT